jgi:hypothetical protein
MIRRCYQHHIHILAIQDPAEVLGGIRPLSPLFFTNLQPFGDARFVHVTNHRAIHLRI